MCFPNIPFHASGQKGMVYKEVCLLKVDPKNPASNSWLGVDSIGSVAVSASVRSFAELSAVSPFALLEPPGDAVARKRSGSLAQTLPRRPGTALSQAPLRVNRHGRRGRSPGRCAQHGQPPAAAAW